MRLKSHLQYERDFCTLMSDRGCHAERVAASGRRRGSVCDVVLFTRNGSYLVEVKSTKAQSFAVQEGLHGIIEASERVGVRALIAIYFKSAHSSKGSGKWVIRVLDRSLRRLCVDDRSDEV